MAAAAGMVAPVMGGLVMEVVMVAVMVAAVDIAHRVFGWALITAGIALICFAAWFALWASGRLFAKMYPHKEIEK